MSCLPSSESSASLLITGITELLLRITDTNCLADGGTDELCIQTHRVVLLYHSSHCNESAFLTVNPAPCLPGVMPSSSRLHPSTSLVYDYKRKPNVMSCILTEISRAWTCIYWLLFYYSASGPKGSLQGFVLEETEKALCQCLGKITMTGVLIIKFRYRLPEECKHSQSIHGHPVYPLVVSSSHRADHIAPIPPKKAAYQRTGFSVNSSEIYLRSSHHVSCDPEQGDMLSNKKCQRASKNSAALFSSSLILFVNLSSLGTPLPERQKGKQTESRGAAVQQPATLRHSQDPGGFFSLSPHPSVFLSVAYLAAASLLGLDLQQMLCLEVPAEIFPILRLSERSKHDHHGRSPSSQ